MNVWNSLPFVRLLISFVAGIILGIQFPSFLNISWLVFCFPLLAYIVIANKYASNYQFRFIKGIPIIIFFLLFGIKLVQLRTEIYYENHFSKKVEDIYLVKIAEPPKKKLNTFKIIGEVIEVRHQKKWVPTKGKLLIYIAKDSVSNQLRYGDIILCKSKITGTPAPKNPFEFNYKKYLGFHQIYHQAYLTSQHWIKTGKSQTNTMLALSYQLRDYLLHLIAINHITGDRIRPT
jgi:competence protein ComEC